MDIITIANQKGGAGKTTTAAALWYWLNANGKKALGVDLDAQGNFSYSVGAKDSTPSILDVLQGKATTADAIQHLEGGDFIPSTFNLNGADIALKGDGTLLRAALRGLAYDYVIIDTEPHLGILTANALMASNKVVIPLQADIYSMQGLKQLWGNIQAVREKGNPSLSVDGLLLTRYNARTNLSKELTDVFEKTARTMETRVYKAKIREATLIKEAALLQASIFDMTPPGKVIEDYQQFINELLDNERTEC